jgi:RNA polymerase sigma factor (sigma-70 family)
MSPLALSLRFLQAQPDSRLVALARDGHEPAFEALVRRYRKELLAYCRRLMAQSGNAEDVLQQALLQAWKALDGGAEVTDVRPWLYRIAHNVAISYIRAASAAPQRVQEAGSGPGVDQIVEQRLRVRAVLTGIASLPTLQRDALVSSAVDGASHEEIATALGLSSGSVRGLIYRARATVRAAAAALIPSPLVGWALRRAETRTGGTQAMVEALAGGGGAGVVGLVAKGGVVITLAGAVAGGGVIITHSSSHHLPSAARRAASRSVAAASEKSSVGETVLAGSPVSIEGAAGLNTRTASHGRDSSGADGQARSGSRHVGGRDGGGDNGRSTRGSDGGALGGTDGASPGGSDRSGGGGGGSRGGSDGASDGADGAALSGVATAAVGTGIAGGSLGSSGRSGGGSDGSDGTSGHSAPGSGTSTQSPVTTMTTTTSTTTSTSRGGSGADRGSRSGSGSSGPGD